MTAVSSSEERTQVRWFLHRKGMLSLGGWLAELLYVRGWGEKMVLGERRESTFLYCCDLNYIGC